MKSKIIKHIALFSCLLFVLSTLLLGINYISPFGPKDKKNNNPGQTTEAMDHVSELYDSSTKTWNRENVFDLLSKLKWITNGNGFDTSATIYASTFIQMGASDFRWTGNASMQSDLYVTIRGIDWNPLCCYGYNGRTIVTFIADDLIYGPYKWLPEAYSQWWGSSYPESELRTKTMGLGGKMQTVGFLGIGSYEDVAASSSNKWGSIFSTAASDKTFQEYLISPRTYQALPRQQLHLIGTKTSDNDLRHESSGVEGNWGNDLLWIPSYSEYTSSIVNAENWDKDVWLRAGWYEDQRTYKGANYWNCPDTQDYSKTCYLMPCFHLDLGKVISSVTSSNKYALWLYKNNPNDKNDISITGSPLWEDRGNYYAKTHYKGAKLYYLPTLSKPGYIFNGWYTSSTGGSQVTDDTRCTGVDYYAHWTAITYKVKFDANGGSISGSTELSCTYYNDSSVFPTASKTGYTFLGWSKDRSATVSSYAGGVKHKNDLTTTNGEVVTLYAVYTPNAYKVTFDPGGGTISGNAENYFNYGQRLGQKTNLYDPNRAVRDSGITLSGSTFSFARTTTTQWYNFNTPFSHRYMPNTKYTMIVYATVGTNKPYFTITSPYDAGEEGLGDIAAVQCHIETLTSGLHKEVFTTKANISNSTQNDFRSHLAVSNNTYYSVTFQLSLFVGEVDYTNFTYSSFNNANTSITSIPAVTKTGFTLNGWYDAASGGTRLYDSSVMNYAKDMTVYAQWTEHTYTLYLYPQSGKINGSTATQQKSLKYTESYTLPTPTRDGYTFLGWYTQPTGGTKKSSSVSKLTSSNNGSYKLYAQWEENWTNDVDTTLGGEGTESSPYQISSANELAYIAQQINKGSSAYINKNYIQTSSFSLAEHPWVPIGTSSYPFKGSYDGQGYIISDYKSSSVSQSYLGIFGYVDGAKISNIVLSSGTVKGSQNLGGIVGYAKGSTSKSVINHCINLASISGTRYTGGIVGYSSNSDITFCANYAKISALSLTYAGGIVGNQVGGQVTNCFASCDVGGTGISNYVGGIAGKSTGKIANCGFIGEVYISKVGATSRIAGMICCGADSFSVVDCFAKATGATLFAGAGNTSAITDCLYISGTTKKYYGSATSFKNWVIAPGTPMGFLPKGFSWFASGGTSTTLTEIQGAGYTPA